MNDCLRFSVIITTFDRPEQLARALAALARSDYPRTEFEVIVVDDGGSDPLEDIVSGFRTAMTVKLIKQATNGGPAKGRNAGAEVARNEFLSFTDDDCEPAPDWLSTLAGRLRQSPKCLVGGRTVNGLTENPYSAASQLIIDMVYASYNADPEQSQFFTSNNLAVRADLFRQCGAFDESFRVSEDRELCNRWRHCGLRMSYEPEAVVEHRHPLTLRAFWRQHFSYGRGAARYHKTCGERGSGRLQDDFGFYSTLPRLWREVTRSMPRRQMARIVPVLLLWQTANAAGFFYERFKSRRGRLEH